jgi:hypothetical protein
MTGSAKQSIAQHKERMDCFVASAPRNDECRHKSAIPRRDAPELCILDPPRRGRGECRVPAAPAASCALCSGRTHTSNNEYTGNHPASPHAMVLTAYTVLSPAIGLFCHRRLRKLPFANLTPASRRQDHTTLPSASAPFVIGASASTASHPASVTIAIRPSCGEDGGYIPESPIPVKRNSDNQKLITELLPRHFP